MYNYKCSIVQSSQHSDQGSKIFHLRIRKITDAQNPNQNNMFWALDDNRAARIYTYDNGKKITISVGVKETMEQNFLLQVNNLKIEKNDIAVNHNNLTVKVKITLTKKNEDTEIIEQDINLAQLPIEYSFFQL